MDIGIIGTGNVGAALGRAWAGRGHRVVYGSRDPKKAEALAASVGQGARGGSIRDAATAGAVVLLALPWSAAEDALRAAGPLSGTTLIDCTNPLRQDDFTEPEAWDRPTSGAERIAAWAPGARVVKAFNTAFAHVMDGRTRFGSRDATLFFCGDDAPAKEAVAALIADAGFEPVDVGALENARLLEPLGLLMIRLGLRVGLGTDVALTLLRR